MTTYVPKGANRASAYAKREKAAQRRPKVSPAELDAQVESIVETAIKNVRSRKAAAEQQPQEVQDENFAKANALVATAAEAGWEATAVLGDITGRVVVTITRDHERIVVTFLDNKLDSSQMPYFVRGDGSRVLLRNVSAVKKQMAADPSARPVKSERSVIRVRESHAEQVANEEPVRNLPWDTDEIEDEALHAFFAKGVRITWRNSISKTIEECVVPPKAPGLQIVRHPHRPANRNRVVSFMSMTGHYRSIGLDRMLRADQFDKEQAADARDEFRTLLKAAAEARATTAKSA